MFDLMPLTTAAVELARELAPAVDVMFDNAWKEVTAKCQAMTCMWFAHRSGVWGG